MVFQPRQFWRIKGLLFLSRDRPSENDSIYQKGNIGHARFTTSLVWRWRRSHPSRIMPCLLYHSLKFPSTDQKYPQLFSGTWRRPWHMRDCSAQQASRTLDTHWRCLFLFLASGRMSCSDQVWRRQSRAPRYPDQATWRWPSVWMASEVARHTLRAWSQRRSRCANLFPFHPRSGKCGRTFCSRIGWWRNTGYRRRLVVRSSLHFVCEHNRKSSTKAGHRSLRILAVLRIPPDQPGCHSLVPVCAQ